eukprot:CAMPEP_0177601210 /NCGR_PEP_ID=MMETSP0419_2-20121207/14113_1 /TAXON_ID=582737 /ORGANISM="Tetraselmis sp., Strain GSL018" /LENGTH=635 /DNA_ID=CAMNT_0019094411 /DNA_START=275 /DNA_END=2182 /DNA_ORIENTATION=+
MDVSKEPVEQVVQKLMEFLRTVKYRPEMDQIQFRQLMAQADSTVVHPVLKWVLSQTEVLSKRAFVGYYMTPVLMPAEHALAPDVAELRAEIIDLQQQFAELHKMREDQLALNKDPQVLKERSNKLEKEKETLKEKIARVKDKTGGVKDLKRLHEACSALRKQQDEEVELSQKLTAQRQQLNHVEQKYQRSMARLREFRNSAIDGTATGILEQARDEHARLRETINEKLPRDMEKRQKRLQIVQQVLSDGFNTEADLYTLKQRLDEINADIAAVTERRQRAEKEAQGNKAYQQLRSTQQMANVVAKKKEEIMAKLERLADKKESLETEYGRRVAHEDGGMAQPSQDAQANPGGASESDYKAKYAEIKSKLPVYKERKKLMGDLEGELSVLERTLDVLGEKEQELMAEVSQIEREKGVLGFSETQASLEKVSEAKSAIDEEKGSMLEEISRTVTEINQAIKDRKSNLAPQIKDLRTMRTQFQEREVQHAEKKKAFESAKAGYESKLSKLDGEVAGYKAEIAEAESSYHQANCRLKIADVSIGRVTQGSESLDLRDKLQRRVKEAEEENQGLKSRHKHLKDSAAPSQDQMVMLRDLKRLIDTKMQVLKKGNVGQFGSAAFGSAEPSTFSTEMGNMMVL